MGFDICSPCHGIGEVLLFKTMGRLQAIEDAAFQVAHELPQRHTITRPFRGARFKRAATRLLDRLYDLEWEHFNGVRDFQLVEHAIALVIATIQLHVLTSYSTHHDSECRFFADMIERLRAAQDAVRQGWPPHPSKHPTQEWLEESSSDRLAKVLKNHASVRGTRDQDHVRAEAG